MFASCTPGLQVPPMSQFGCSYTFEPGQQASSVFSSASMQSFPSNGAFASPQPQASPSKRKFPQASDIPLKMARVDPSSSTDRRVRLRENDGSQPTWHGVAGAAETPSPLAFSSPHQQKPLDSESVESFVLGVMSSRSMHVSPAALDFSSRAVMDMVCAAHRNHNQASLALVPYKSGDDVLMESLTVFQQKEQFRQRHQQQQHAALWLDNHQQHQQQHQQQQHDHLDLQQQHEQQQDIHKYPHFQPEIPEKFPPMHPAHKRRRLAHDFERTSGTDDGCCYPDSM